MVGEDIIIAFIKLIRGRGSENTVELHTFPPVPTVNQMWSSSTSIHITSGGTYIFPAGLWDIDVYNEHAADPRYVRVECNINSTWRTMYYNDLSASTGISVGVWISDGTNLRITLESSDVKARVMRMS